MDRAMEESTFVIIGGGISGVSCVEGIAFLAPEEKVTLVTCSPVVKTLKNIVPLGKTLFQFDIEEKEGEFLSKCHPSVTVLQNTVIKVYKDDKIVELDNGKRIRYNKLCLCNGGKPKLIVQDNPYVIGIRDTESVVNFSRKIKDARRIVVVGNGGIATEIVHELQGVEMIWVIKDKHISATFIDPGAAEFFQDKLNRGSDPSPTSSPTKRMKYTISDGTITKGGPALGPDWHNNLKIQGTCTVSTAIQVEYESEVKRILLASEVEETDEKWSVYAELTTGKVIGCDFIVSATGVIPNSDLPGLESLEKGEDEGFLVDWKLETSEKDIYAAGDVCTANWELAQHWFQMRLWTQAHQMGRYAAKAMVHGYRKEEFFQDFCFELFTHVTKFFGYKVVLIGLYNAQKLNKSYDILLRMTRGKEYIKLVMANGKMQGAVLIGDTDLEEMCENLILNQLDLSMYGEDLLNPDIDIEDYFD